jgi:PAS domain S-box-containing protein
MGSGFLALPLAFGALYLSSLYSFHLFHILSEFFGIIVGCGAFMVAWNTRRVNENHFILFVGLTYLFVGAVDLLHTLTYQGLGVFEHTTPDHPVQFWIAARYLEAFALLLAPWFVGRRLKAPWVLAGLSLVTGGLVVSIYLGIFPACYRDDLGTTVFKSVSEYVVCGIIILAALFTWQKRAHLDSRVLNLLILAMATTILAEVSFSSYVGLFGVFNKLGHYLKILSFYLIYKAIVQASLTRPHETMFGDLTRHQAALRESRQRFQTLVEESFDGTFVVKGDHVVFANQALYRLLGYEPGRLEGLEYWKMYHPDYQELVRQRGRARMQGAENVVSRYEVRAQRRDGTAFDAELSAKRIMLDGEPAVQCWLRDVSERKLAEEAQKASEARYRSLTALAPVGIFQTDAKGDCLYVNERWSELAGLTGEEALGRGWLNAIHPDDRERVTAQWRQAAGAAGAADEFSLDFRMRTPAGKISWISGRAARLLDDFGGIAGYLGTITDVSEAKRSEEELRRLGEEYGDLYHKAPCGFHSLDGDGVFVRINDTELAWLGYSRHEVEGRMAFPQVITPASREAFFKGFEKFKRAGAVVGLEYEMVRKDGSTFWVELSATAVRDEQGRYLYSRSAVVDVSARKRMEDDLQRAKAQAEAATQAKSAFLASMSHEIRTPLNGVIGMTGLLLDTELSHEQRQFAETARSSGQALLSLINDILDFSKIEAGRLELEKVVFSPYRVVEDVLDIASSLAHGKGLELWSLVETEAAFLVNADIGRVRQVLFNLVGNAVKFTQRGEVGVRISLVKRQQGRVWLRFQVHDTGIGIAPEAAGRLFQPFSQADAGTSRRHGGTGLGLSISKRLVELMGGEIGLESSPGKGSQFWFVLPLEEAPAQADPAEAGLAALAGVRVLCVEKNAGTLASLATALTGWGLFCEEASSGVEALERLREACKRGQSFQLAIMDQQLPVMDGLTLANILREDTRLRTLPLVVICPFARAGTEREQLQARFDVILNKPVRREKLRQCLLSLLSPDKAAQDATGETSQPDQPLRRARILLAEDNQVNQQLAVHLLTRLGHRVDVAGNGQEALEAHAKLPYDLVVMDCQMPERDGFSATREIRSWDGEKGRVPIIAMTAHAMPGDRQRCLDAGMDDYVSKPIQPRSLAEAVERQLRRRDDQRTLAGQLTGVQPGALIFDLRDLVARVEGDAETARVLVRLFREGAPERLARLGEAMAGGDYRAVIAQAHGFRGELANLSAWAASQEAGALEAAAQAGEPHQARKSWEALQGEYQRLLEALRQAGLAD